MPERETIEALPLALRAPYKAALLRDRTAEFGLAKGTRITRGPLTIEFDDAPRIIENRAAVGVAIDATVRVFRDGRELRVDPHRICVNPPILVPDGTVTVEKRSLHGLEIEVEVPGYREDPVEAYLRWLIESIEEKPAENGFRTRGTVTTVYAGADNGFIDSNDATYSTARSGSGFYVSSSDDPTHGYTFTAGQYYLDMAFIRFDTSSIGDSDTIDDVDLSLWGVVSDFDITPDITLEARTGYTWSGSGVTSADWRNGTQYAALTRVATFNPSGWSNSAYNLYTEDGTNFRSAINKTGYTEITMSCAAHASGTAPVEVEYATFRNASASGTTNDPKLVVTHTAGGGPTLVNLAGAQPASTGTLAKKYLKALAGAQPASTGTIAARRTLSHIALAGAQPAASGDITAKQFEALAGAQPAATGSVAAVSVYSRTVTGAQPASTGTLAKKYLKALAGAQPGASGALAADITLRHISLAGAQPAASGDITAKQFKALAGAQPAATGTIDADVGLVLVTVTGAQPAATGALVAKFTSKHLAGAQPAGAGALAARQTLARSLAGAQPAGSGALNLRWILAHVALAGAQPSATGIIRALVTAIELAGVQPSASGTISVVTGITTGWIEVTVTMRPALEMSVDTLPALEVDTEFNG